MALHEATNPQRLRFGVDKGGHASRLAGVGHGAVSL